MELIEAIKTRKSVRGFKPDPVPKNIIREVLEIATWSPSAMNTQPWEFTVLTGAALDRLRKANVEKLNSGATPHAETPHKPFEGKYRQRQVDLAIKLFNLMGITREDKQKRVWWMERGFRAFDAPVAIILTIEKSLDESALSQLDMGSLMQTLCLAALHYGLGTCIEDQGVMFPENVRQVAGIPDSRRIVICIAMGYPDDSFPANTIRTIREPVDGLITWRDG